MAIAAIPLVMGAMAGGTAVAAGATAATALTIGAMAFSATAAIQGGMQQAALHRYNASVSEMNARSSREWAQYEARRHEEKSAAFLARQEAAFAGNGVVGTEGSPLLMMADTAANAELDRLAIIHKGELQATRYYNEAQGSRFGAQIAMESAYMKAGASLLQGASSAAAMNSGWFSSSPEPFTIDKTVPTDAGGNLQFDP